MFVTVGTGMVGVPFRFRVPPTIDIMITGKDGDDAYPQILLTNSRDGKAAFNFRVGIFRLVCSNGLVVSDVMYTPHNLNKPDKIPCLRVKYIAENPKDDISEYICLQHTGFAYQKAIKWWNEMGGIKLAQGLTILQIYEKKYHNTLKKPTFIEVKKDGKYDRVVGYDFTPPPNESQLDNDDWSEFDMPF